MKLELLGQYFDVTVMSRSNGSHKMLLFCTSCVKNCSTKVSAITCDVFHLPRDVMTKQQLVKFARKLYRQFLQYDFLNVRDAAFPQCDAKVASKPRFFPQKLMQLSPMFLRQLICHTWDFHGWLVIYHLCIVCADPAYSILQQCAVIACAASLIFVVYLYVHAGCTMQLL